MTKFRLGFWMFLMCRSRRCAWVVSGPFATSVARVLFAVFFEFVGPCMRCYHSACVRHQGERLKSWKCSLCQNKETDVFRWGLLLSFRNSQKCFDLPRKSPRNDTNFLDRVSASFCCSTRRFLSKSVIMWRPKSSQFEFGWYLVCKVQRVRQTHPQPTSTLRHVRFSLPPRLSPPKQHRSLESFHRVHVGLMFLS